MAVDQRQYRPYLKVSVSHSFSTAPGPCLGKRAGRMHSGVLRMLWEPPAQSGAGGRSPWPPLKPRQLTVGVRIILKENFIRTQFGIVRYE